MRPEIDDRAWPGRQCRAVRWKRPAGSCGLLACAPSGLLRGISLPPPGVRLFAGGLPKVARVAL